MVQGYLLLMVPEKQIVSYDNQRKLWVAQITYQRKNHLTGRFKTKEEAIKACEAAEITHFGKYRKKNI